MNRRHATAFRREPSGAAGRPAPSGGGPRGWRRRALGCCLGCIGAGVLMVVLAALVMRPPPAPPLPPPVEMERGRERVERVRREVERVAASPEPAALVPIDITEQDLNSFIATDRGARDALAEARVTSAFVRIHEGIVELTAERQALGLPVGATAHIRPQLHAEGRLRFEVERVTLGLTGVSLEGPRRMAERIALRFAEGRLDPSVRVEQMRVEPGVIRLRVRPLRGDAHRALSPAGRSGSGAP
ncbi:MAG TPA: hypothetical protein VLH79_09575 [Chthonomonadales bacterium]|nr:hypothetical protein [Chthonomonadales bacterium]